MLIGEFESKVGDKNRIAVPKKFRSELSENLIITRGYEQCLILLDEKRWKKLIRSIEVKPLLSANVRNVKRYLVGGAQEIDLDHQGRFVVNTMLKEFANFKEEIVFIGIEDWVEIWDKEKWIAKIHDLSNKITDIADRLVEQNK